MRQRDHILLTLAVMSFLGGSPTVAQETSPSPPTVVDAARGQQAWEEIYAVFSHPRCSNCHVEGERPMWSGAHYGVTRVHAFNVQRGIDGSGFGNAGLRCAFGPFSETSTMSTREQQQAELRQAADLGGPLLVVVEAIDDGGEEQAPFADGPLETGGHHDLALGDGPRILGGAGATG